MSRLLQRKGEQLDRHTHPEYVRRDEYLQGIGPPSGGRVGLHTRVYSSSAQTLSSGIYTRLEFSAAYDDDDGMFTASNELVCQRSGIYLFSGYVSFGAGSGLRRLQIQVSSGFGPFLAVTSRDGLSFLDAMAVSGVARLASGVAVYLYGMQLSGGDLDVQAGAQFSATWLGD